MLFDLANANYKLQATTPRLLRSPAAQPTMKHYPGAGPGVILNTFKLIR
ncbi:hypothetical protein M5D96_000271, partial [Drosophila gunungcola]